METEKIIENEEIEQVTGEVVNDNLPELVIQATPISPITFNFAEMKDKAVKLTDQYKNIAITDDSYKASKADAKKLAGLRIEIKKKCTAIKKQYTAPIKEFETQCKELENIFTNAEDAIKSQTVVYDQKRVKEKQDKIDTFRDKEVASNNLRPEFAEGIYAEANLSCTFKDLKEDISSQILQRVKKQQNYDLAVTSAEATITAVNSRIEQKLSMQDSDILDEIRLRPETVAEYINTKADKLETAEKAIKEKAIQEAAKIAADKAAKEAEEAAKAAEEMCAASQDVIPDSAPFMAEPVFDTPVVDAVPEIPVAETVPVTESPVIEVPTSNDVQAEAPAGNPFAQFDQPSSPKYKMTIILEGSFDDLKNVGPQLKNICAANNCSYQIDTANSGVINQ